jgi:hypothetical protein
MTSLPVANFRWKDPTRGILRNFRLSMRTPFHPFGSHLLVLLLKWRYMSSTCIWVRTNSYLWGNNGEQSEVTWPEVTSPEVTWQEETMSGTGNMLCACATWSSAIPLVEPFHRKWSCAHAQPVHFLLPLRKMRGNMTSLPVANFRWKGPTRGILRNFRLSMRTPFHPFGSHLLVLLL